MGRKKLDFCYLNKNRYYRTESGEYIRFNGFHSDFIAIFNKTEERDGGVFPTREEIFLSRGQVATLSEWY